MGRLKILALVAVTLLMGAGCRGETDPATGQGVSGRTITIGELVAHTGPISVVGRPLTRGHEVYFEYVNEELGGIGRDLPEDERYTVDLRVLDGQYVPDRHVEQFNAMRNDVLAIGQSLGTPTTKAILPGLRDEPILTGAATLSVEWLNEPFIFTAGAPYAVQFINAADHIVNENGTKPKAGIIYQDDDYGQEGLKGLEFAAAELGFDIVSRATYRPTDREFTAQVNRMRRDGADHVFLTAIPSAAGGIFGAAATVGYAPRWISQSPTWARALFTNPDLAEYMRENVWWVTDASCAWGETGDDCEGMARMLENMEKYAPDQEPDVYFQFGYTQALILHQILERAVADENLTPEGVIEAFQSLENVDLGGLLNPVSYGSECADRVPATATSIYSVDPDEPLAVAEVATVDGDVAVEYPFCP